MTRASRARTIASAAAYGGGGLVGAGATVLGVLVAEAALARRAIGSAEGEPPDPSGSYVAPAADPTATPVHLVLAGDSSAAGLGVDEPGQTPAAVLARGLSAHLRCPVVAAVVAQVGAQSSALEAQLDRVLPHDGSALSVTPDLVVVMVGANDVTHRVMPAESVRHLGEAVRRLRAADVDVVVGTCPDLGTVQPIRHPLRLVARRWSRALAAAQTIAVVEAGGRSVSLADLLGDEFRARPHELFGPDKFHPSPAGYAAAAGALLPSSCDALDERLARDVGGPGTTTETSTDVMPVADAAVEAVEAAGTEVVGAQVDGRRRGRLGRWAALRPGRSAATTDDAPAEPEQERPEQPAAPGQT